MVLPSLLSALGHALCCPKENSFSSSHHSNKSQLHPLCEELGLVPCFPLSSVAFLGMQGDSGPLENFNCKEASLLGLKQFDGHGETSSMCCSETAKQHVLNCTLGPLMRGKERLHNWNQFKTGMQVVTLPWFWLDSLLTNQGLGCPCCSVEMHCTT